MLLFTVVTGKGKENKDPHLLLAGIKILMKSLNMYTVYKVKNENNIGNSR